jgi:hypothetical protein
MVETAGPPDRSPDSMPVPATDAATSANPFASAVPMPVPARLSAALPPPSRSAGSMPAAAMLAPPGATAGTPLASPLGMPVVWMAAYGTTLKSSKMAVPDGSVP